MDLIANEIDKRVKRRLIYNVNGKIRKNAMAVECRKRLPDDMLQILNAFNEQIRIAD